VKILIIKMSAIGDVIHTLPALNALRQHFPEANITWLVEEAAADLVVGHPALDRVIVSCRKRWAKALLAGPRKEALKAAGAFLRALRDTRYDVILDFQALLKSGVMVALARGGRKIGFDRGMAHMEHSYLLLNERIPPVSMEIHALVRNLMMLEPLGIHTRDVTYRLPISAKDRKTAGLILESSALSPGKIRIAINPVAKWATKLWEPHKFSQLADRLASDLGAGVFFTGGVEDRNIINEITGKMRNPALNLAGKTTLKELAALYEIVDLLVSTDTGPMHLGAAVGTPVVALFGPTAPWRTGPYGSRNRVVRINSFCSPCFKRDCENNFCMTKISLDHVFQEVKGTVIR